MIEKWMTSATITFINCRDSQAVLKPTLISTHFGVYLATTGYSIGCIKAADSEAFWRAS